MYLWRLSIALALGLVWYFSDCGRSLTQYCICCLFCFTTPLLLGSSGQESGTQTDEETKEHPLQESVEEESCDMTDEGSSFPLKSHHPHVKRSLRQVFESAYAQLVLPWYGVPEPCELQPLHKALSGEFDFVIERIVEQSRNFDVCQALVGSIKIFTQHLHNAKQPDREPLFSSTTLEMQVLRELSDALVRNLFSRSFWSQEINHCVLNEIIALKGLGLVVNWLSEPDNLNQLVVNQLDSAALKGAAEELRLSDPDQASLASQEGEGDREGSEVSHTEAEVPAEAENNSKKRANRIREGWSKFVDKMKSKKAKKKKMKKLEQNLVMRIISREGNVPGEDDASSKEGSVVSQDDSDKEDSDLDEYLASVQEDLMEFKLSYEMWRVGRWAVSIPHTEWENKELVFTVHLEEQESPENLQWDIKKTYLDVIYFRNRWQDSTSLSSIFVLDHSEVGHEVEEAARASVEHFLQELVSDSMIGHTQPVFQFLCPLDKLLNEEEHYGGVWGLLSGLAYFLTPGHDEEEQDQGSLQNPSLQAEEPKETPVPVPSPHPEAKTLSVENHCNSAQSDGNIPASPLPSIVISEYNSPSNVPDGAETDPQPAPSSESMQEKSDNPDHTPTSHFKMMFRGLSRTRSQESLASSKASGDEEQLDEFDGPRLDLKRQKERLTLRITANKSKGKGLQKGEDSQCQRGQINWEELEGTKAIFDLLKEISGNSILINIFDAVLKPVMPILKKKINSFLNKLNPTEEQMAAYIDTLRSKLWPEIKQVAAPPARTEEEKKETRERAHDLINARYSNYLILKKTDVEAVFNLFQNSEENKTLIYMLLSFLLREFLPNEPSLSVSSAVLQKVSSG